MLSYLNVLAQRNRSTKFLKIQADLCIPNYPDRNVPTLVVYGDGDLKANIVGVDRFGGSLMSLENVEFVLAGLGAVVSFKSRAGKDDDDEDDEDEHLRKRTVVLQRKAARDEDDDWD